MTQALLLSFSLVLQIGAAVLALRLIRVTGARLAWLTIAGAVALMALRRALTVTAILAGDATRIDVRVEAVAVVISALMLAGLAMIGPWFAATRRSDAAVLRLNRTLRTIGACNRALTRSVTEPELFRTTCQILVDIGGYRLAWIGRVGNQAEGTVRAAAHVLADDHDRDWLRAVFAEAERGGGPTGAAARTNTAQRWTATGDDPGPATLLAVPVESDGAVPAILTVGAAEPRAFGDEERRLLRELAEDLGYGIRTFRLRAERAAAAQALHEAEERLLTVVRHAPVVLWTLDRDGVFTLSEGRGLAALDLTPGQIVGRSIFEVYADHPQVLADARRALAGEVVASTAVVNRAVYDLRYSPLRTPDGTLLGTIGVAIDITARHELENQLRQAQKMEELGLIASGIAHDFNNLFSVILLDAQAALAAVDRGTAPDRADLESIEESARNAAATITKLLGLSRKAELAPGPTDLVQVVDGLATLLRRTLPEHIRIELPPGQVATVSADPLAVEQMLLNLVTNARDAMPDGGTLRIAVEQTTVRNGDGATPDSGPASYGCVSVTDTGTGMDDETQTRVFEPFFTTKPRGKGTGLGLPMVRSLTRQLHGFVELTSEVGRGTMVRLYFPCLADAAPAARAGVAPAVGAGGTETILLVEDEPALRRSARRVLERHGYTVIAAEDGEVALECFRVRRSEISLVLSDLVMPKMRGDDLYRALRDAYGPVPFVLASGYGGEATGTLDPGIRLVQKPWSMGELLSTVRGALDAHPPVAAG